MTTRRRGDGRSAGVRYWGYPATSLVGMLVIAAGSAALLWWLADRSGQELPEDAFLAAVTVLAFLLAASALAGSLHQTSIDTVRTVQRMRQEPDAQEADIAAVIGDLGASVWSVRTLPRGVGFAALAVALSMVAFAGDGHDPAAHPHGLWRILAACSLGLLISATLATLPVTFRLIADRGPSDIYDFLNTAYEQGRLAPYPPPTGQPGAAPPGDTSSSTSSGK